MYSLNTNKGRSAAHGTPLNSCIVCGCLQVNLAQNLTAAFWKYSGMADGEDDDGEGDDMGK
jgi:hypothetical protein